jgi:hypothetical protein
MCVRLCAIQAAYLGKDRAENTDYNQARYRLLGDCG